MELAKSRSFRGLPSPPVPFTPETGDAGPAEAAPLVDAYCASSSPLLPRLRNERIDPADEVREWSRVKRGRLPCETVRCIAGAAEVEGGEDGGPSVAAGAEDSGARSRFANASTSSLRLSRMLRGEDIPRPCTSSVASAIAREVVVVAVLELLRAESRPSASQSQSLSWSPPSYREQSH